MGEDSGQPPEHDAVDLSTAGAQPPAAPPDHDLGPQRAEATSTPGAGAATAPSDGAGHAPPKTTPASSVHRPAEQVVLDSLSRGQRVEAITLLMKMYGRPLMSFILRMVRHRETAEDIRQQVFLEAFKGIDDFQHRASLFTWLVSIARNRCLDALKKDRRIAATDDFDVLNALHWQPDPSMDEDIGAKRCALEHCLGKLPAAMRAELVMRFLFGLSYAEIEKLNGVAAGTLQVRVTRNLVRLRKCLRCKGIGK